MIEQYNMSLKVSHKKIVVKVYDKKRFKGYKSGHIRFKRNTTASRKKSNVRAKYRIIDLLENNFSREFTFCTLTFRENVSNIQIANDTFARFVRKLKKYLKKQYPTYPELKYVNVLETQGRGAIHYHMVTNIPKFIDFKTIINLWVLSIEQNDDITIKGGSVFIEYSSDSLQIENISFYLSKYLTKSQSNPVFLGKKTYSCSKNLNKPLRYDFYWKELSLDNYEDIISDHFSLSEEDLLSMGVYQDKHLGTDIIHLEYKNN